MEFSFLTYNIHKCIGNDRKFRIDRTIEVLRKANADFMMLQEVDHHVPRSHNLETARVLAEALGMHYSIGLNVKLKRGAYGNATLSRYPIIRHRNIDLTWGIKKARGALVTHIEAPSGEIVIVNYHLGLAGVERDWQIKKLLHSKAIRQMENHPIVILGDSNDRNHKINPEFLKHGFVDTCRVTNIKTFPSYAPLWRLDKIFVNGHLEIKEHRVILDRKTRASSDHLPVIARARVVS